MARTPSFDAQFEKTKAAGRIVEELCARLAQSVEAAQPSSSDAALEADAALLGEMLDAKNTFAADSRRVIQGLSARIDAAYLAFDRADDVTRKERFLAFFTRKPRNSFRASRQRRLAVAESVQVILAQAAVVYRVLEGCKETSAPLVTRCEARLEASMEARRKVVLSIDDARQRDRELAATVATLERRIATSTDDTQSDRWSADRDDAAGRRDAVLAERKALNDERDVLDRQAILFGDMIDALNDGVSIYSHLLNAVSIEAERCIMLHDVAYGSLQPLLEDLRLFSQAGDEMEHPPRPGPFHHLLTLHAKGAVTMQDVDRRKIRLEDALADHFERSEAKMIETGAGKT